MDDRPFPKLGVLDQAPIAEGATPGDALRNSLALARLCDRLGFERFWLAEHHGTPALACASPEAFIGTVAAETSRIRVGSGGIMLPHYSALKVAETFSMLASTFPARIDLGIGRAAGTSPAIAYALQRDRRQPLPDDFRDQLDELLALFDANPNPDGSDAGLLKLKKMLPPFAGPGIYLLGSSPQSAIWAAELGLPYVFADFINANGAAIADYYRRAFRPSALLSEPRLLVAAWAICADSDADALRLSASSRMLMNLLYRGELIPVPSVEKAESFLQKEGVRADFMPPGRRLIYGSPNTVRAGLQGLSREYGSPDEILLVNILHSAEARRHSYELIAEEFHLTAEPVAA